MKAIYGGTVILGVLAIVAANCNHNDAVSPRPKEPHVTREPSTAEQRRAEGQRAEEQRAEERKDARFIGGGPAEPSSAVARIAAARCEREVRCNNVGAKGKYPNRADCATRIRDDKRDTINEKDCPGGIDAKQLNHCLAEVRDEPCRNPLVSISRLVSCRSSRLCLK
jgi:Family of unknown function (DUF6184)